MFTRKKKKTLMRKNLEEKVLRKIENILKKTFCI